MVDYRSYAVTAVLLWIFVSQSDALKCITCGYMLQTINGTAVPNGGDPQSNQADCKSNPKKYEPDALLCSSPASGEVVRCIFGDATVEATMTDPFTGYEGEIEITMQNRGCVTFKTDVDPGDGCLKDAQLDVVLGDMTESFSDVEIEGQGCICTKDICNSAISTRSVGLLVCALIALLISFVKHV